MVVIVHYNIAMDQNVISVMIVFQYVKELSPVRVIKEDIPSLIASARHMV